MGLENSADADVADIHGRSPLAIASAMKLQLPDHHILSDGATCDVPIYSIQEGTQVAAVLLRAGAVPHCTDATGCTPLGLAMAYGNLHLVQLFKNYVRPAEFAAYSAWAQ